MNISKTKCDQCGKESENKDLGGGLQERPRAWIKVVRDSATSHMSDHKDFCSLPCLYSWAAKQMDGEKPPFTVSEKEMGLVK